MKNFFYIAMLLVTLSPLMALAEPLVGGNTSPLVGNNQSPLVGNNSVYQLEDPLKIGSFCDLVKKLLNVVMAIGIPIAVLFLVWSGFRFILARGSQTGLDEAKRNFKFVIIGIAVFLGAWTLASIISATIQSLDSSGTIQFCGK